MSKIDPEDEKLKKELDGLFPKWKKELKKKVKEELEKKVKKELKGGKFEFLKDGALPGYSSQPLKILYIAREAHSGTRSIVDHVVCVRDPKKKARRGEAIRKDGSTKGRPCWSRALGIAYGLIHGVKKWDEIPDLDYFRKSFQKPGDISFAVIEASKYANPKNTSELSGIFAVCAYGSLNIVDDESKPLIRKEIEILNPDLIISWDLRGAFNKDEDGKKNNGDCFLRELTGSKSPEEGSSKNVRIWTYTFDERRDALTGKIKRIPLLDTWHLSTFNKKAEAEIYTPIVEAAKNKCKKVKDIFDKRKKNADKIENEGPNDNALPGYSIQKWKILFVDKDDKTLKYIKKVRSNSKKKRAEGIKRCGRKLRITYGLLHDVKTWDEIPNPNYFKTTVGTPEGVSFAALNENSYEEIERLKPNLIITCNLAKKIYGDKNTYKGIPLIDARKIVSKGKKIRDSYKSIREAVKKLKG